MGSKEVGAVVAGGVEGMRSANFFKVFFFLDFCGGGQAGILDIRGVGGYFLHFECLK